MDHTDRLLLALLALAFMFFWGYFSRGWLDRNETDKAYKAGLEAAYGKAFTTAVATMTKITKAQSHRTNTRHTGYATIGAHSTDRVTALIPATRESPDAN